MYLWGVNQYGQLGDGLTLDKYTPSMVTIPGEVPNFLALGRYHSAALTVSYKLYTWGCNDFGQLGDGTFVTKYTPTLITVKGQFFKTVATGGYTSGALTTGGQLYMWGWSGNGEVGDGWRYNRASPTLISVTVKTSSSYKTSTTVTPVLFQSLAIGFHHSGALSTGGQLYLWGSSMYGQLGGGNTIGKLVPTLVSVASKTVKAFSLGFYHTAAITADGLLYAWGQNSYGQLGDGSITNRFVPTLVSAPGRVFRDVSLGAEHSGALTTGNQLLTWGNNSYGQLGDGTATSRRTPTPISSPAFSTISFGNSHSGGLGTDGQMYLWGQNWFGQVGIYPTTPSNIVPMPTMVTIPGQTPLQLALGAWHSGALAVAPAAVHQALNARREDAEVELEGLGVVSMGEAHNAVLLWATVTAIASLLVVLAIFLAYRKESPHGLGLAATSGCLPVEMELPAATTPVAEATGDVAMA